MIGPEWFWHPLGQCAGTHAELIRCQSYNWHSGLEGNLLAVLALLPLVFAAVAALRKMNRHLECHEAGCKKHGLVVLPSGVRCCHEHDPRFPHGEPQPGHVQRIHDLHLDHYGVKREKGEAL
jgi:hypothetical protein